MPGKIWTLQPRSTTLLVTVTAAAVEASPFIVDINAKRVTAARLNTMEPAYLPSRWALAQTWCCSIPRLSTMPSGYGLQNSSPTAIT